MAPAETMPRHSHGIDVADANESNSNSKSKRNSKRKGTGITEKDESFSANAAALADCDGSGSPATQPPSEGYTAEFEEWWSAYPRKDSKGAAFKAFKIAKSRATVQRLREGAAGYAKRRVGEDPQYTKLPATWLNGDCWNDEIPATGKRKLFAGYVPMGPHGG